MSVRIVGSGEGADLWVRPLVFEASSDAFGVVPPGPAEGDERLVCGRVRCRGCERSGRDCLICDGYRGWSDTGLSTIAVRCVWSGRDGVAQRMTPAAEMHAVAADVSCGDADASARANGMHHLVVVRGDTLVGVTCLCRLDRAERAQPIAGVLDENVLALDIGASLGEAAAAMAALGVGCLPVLDGDVVAGVITRGDLRRLGLPAAALGGRRCVSCGSRHGVRAEDHGVDTCLDCAELRDAFFDSGEGD
jgi:hypothetical protein